MKTAQEVKAHNRTRTVIKCSLCGTTRHVKAGIDAKTSKEAIKRACGFCNHPQTLPINQGWWLEFGLSKNPYVYGPMPRMRTSNRYRMEEARRMGWMAWTWNDEYTQERKGITNKNTIT